MRWIEPPFDPRADRRTSGRPRGRRIPGPHRIRQLLSYLREPIPESRRTVLDARWNELPEELRVGWQVIGRQMAHCGFTLGPAYCSFGCTHCYLPRNANRAPLPTLDEMKAQIAAHREQLGPASGLQITGGDVIDAYRRAGKTDELIEVVRAAVDADLVPMVMTHGQGLLDEPELLDRLLVEGGMRKLAIHIDVTQAGRPDYPIREVRSEADLHPLRERFVDLIHEARERTGIRFRAAHTMTIVEKNLGDVADVIRWLTASPRRLEAFRMLSLQPEADVGRTRSSGSPATPEATWREVCRAVGREVAKDNFYFGHPDCSHVVTLVSLFPEHRLIDLTTGDEEARRFWTSLLDTFGGVGFRGVDMVESSLRRVGLLARRPGFVLEAIRHIRHLMRRDDLRLRDLLRRALVRRDDGFFDYGFLNIVQHNFMSAEQIRAGGETVEKRLAACAFRGAVEGDDGTWTAVPMCSMNTDQRERLYARQIETAGSTDADG